MNLTKDKQVVLITGANRGLGFALVNQFLERDWQVIATARNEEALNEVFKNVKSENIIIYPLDVTQSTSIDSLANYLKREGIELNVLINNAGLGTGKSNVEDPDMEEVRDIFNVNFFGVWELTSRLLPYFKAEGERCVINVSSQMGALDDLNGSHAAYRLSKAALNALSLSLSKAIKPTGIKVHTVCPGWIKTDMGGENAPGSVENGADGVLYLAVTPALPGGRFWRNKKPISW